MNLVEELLSTVHVADARYVTITAHAPWGVAFPSRDVARLVLVTGGPCLLTGTGLSGPRVISHRACILVRAEATFELQDSTDSPLEDCDEMAKSADLSVTIGGEGQRTTIVSTRFAVDPAMANALLDALPSVATIDLNSEAGRLLEATFALVATEAEYADHGPGYIGGKLTEVLFLQALRAGYEDAAQPMGWLAALRDPALGSALREFHRDPSHPWTVDELAGIAHMSRTAFLTRFKKRTGGAPHGYLTMWRMFQAKRLLAETDRSVADVAFEVGYRTGPSLSRAFTRAEGIPPARWRSERTRQ